MTSPQTSKIIRFILLVFTCFFGIKVQATTKNIVSPPKIFVDKGACPFEGCTYGKVKVIKDTNLYSLPDKKVVGKLKKGDYAEAITGEVYTVPFPVKITSNYKNYKAGEIIYILTYEGEGQFKAWYKGKVLEYTEDIPFDFWVKKADYRFDFPKNYKSTWWVKFKLKKGGYGWTKETSNFSGFDERS